MVEFESPVLAEHPTGSDAVEITDLSSMTKLLVRSDRDQFDVVFGTSGRIAGALVCGSRPGEWLVIGEAPACRSAAAEVEDGGFTNVIDHTHSRAMFRVGGAAASSALEKLCSLDWSDAMTPDGAVVSASVARVNCDVIRNDTGGGTSYLIACDRSFGQYLFDCLHDAADEFAP